MIDARRIFAGERVERDSVIPRWVKDDDIGALPVEWNWLEGWNTKPASGTPNAVHFTRGGPWFEQWQNVDYGELWLAERAKLRSGGH